MAESDISSLLAELNIDDQPWTEKQLQDIKSWKKYSADLMVYCEELLENGYLHNNMPKKPTVLITGEKLHAYFLQHLTK